MLGNIQLRNFAKLLMQSPGASAVLRGAPGYSDISGKVYFYQSKDGVLVLTNIKGLPEAPGPCGSRVFGFHIHEGASCTGTPDDPFADTGGHYNPGQCRHPHHAGDLPPLFSNHGQAVMAFLTDRLRLRDIIGRTVVIHSGPDDFTSQPAGNAGKRIACGRIQKGD